MISFPFFLHYLFASEMLFSLLCESEDESRREGMRLLLPCQKKSQMAGFSFFLDRFRRLPSLADVISGQSLEIEIDVCHHRGYRAGNPSAEMGGRTTETRVVWNSTRLRSVLLSDQRIDSPVF